jgi:transposase-like protein
VERVAILRTGKLEAVDVKAVAVDGESPALSQTEVVVRPTRRRFTGKYKARILREVERCKGSGEIGALLRREALYASHLVTWRRQLEADGAGGLSRKRGRKIDPEAGSARKIAQLERANQRLAERLRKAEFIIEFQKKMAILWATPNPDGSEEND